MRFAVSLYYWSVAFVCVVDELIDAVLILVFILSLPTGCREGHSSWFQSELLTGFGSWDELELLSKSSV